MKEADKKILQDVLKWITSWIARHNEIEAEFIIKEKEIFNYFGQEIPQITEDVLGRAFQLREFCDKMLNSR